MKIAFDAKRITHNATGLGNYSRFVVNSLSTSFPEHIYQLYTPGKGKEALRKRIEERPSVSFHYPEGRFDKLFPSLWRTSGLTTTLRKEHVDLFHGLSNEIPMNLKQNGIPAVDTACEEWDGELKDYGDRSEPMLAAALSQITGQRSASVSGTRSTAPGVRPATDIALPDLSNRPNGMIVFLPAAEE